MTKFYLLRHGKVSGPAALYGKTDVLVDDGINKQIAANLMRQNLAIQHIICSPLIRCLSLAQGIGNAQNRTENNLSVVTDLQEMNFGKFDGVAFEQLYQESDSWQLLERFWQKPIEHALPNGEQLNNFYHRTINAWQKIVKDYEKDTLVVCHGGVIRMILAHILGVDYGNSRWFSQLEIGYGSLTTLELKRGTLIVKQIAQPLFTEQFN